MTYDRPNVGQAASQKLRTVENGATRTKMAQQKVTKVAHTLTPLPNYACTVPTIQVHKEVGTLNVYPER